MTGTPSVSWFFAHPGLVEWQPLGNRHRSVIGTMPAGDAYLSDIDTGAILTAAKSVLASSGASDILVL
jgi:hypothetical protein